MNKAIYIATSEANSGKSIVALGLMRMLLGKTAKVGYFRPIIDGVNKGKKDNHISTIISHFNLDINPNDAFAYTRTEYIKKRNEGKEGEVFDKIIEKYKALEEINDFMLVEGTDFSGEGAAIELDANILIAKNLGIPAVIVSSGVDKTLEEFVNGVHITYDSFKEKEVEVLAVIANKVQEKNIKIAKEGIQKNLPKDIFVSVIPLITSLNNPTIKEVAKAIDAKILFGKEHINNQSSKFIVGAMQLRNYLGHLCENCLIITPGDRADIILGALQANISSNYPKIAGIVLTGGITPEKPIIKLIDGLAQVVPILTVNEGTFAVANKIGAVRSHMYAENKEKITTSLNIFDKYVDVDKLNEKLITFKNDSITPRMFQYNLLKRARQQRKHIVLPEGNDDRIITAVARLVQMDIVNITLLGDYDKIVDSINRLGLTVDINKFNIIDPVSSDYFKDFANTLFELRKNKGLTIDMAEDLIGDVSYFGTMMVYKGLADGMVSGAAHTTQHTILPALQFIKTKPGVSVVSSIFFMCLEDRVSVFGDCAINPNPNSEQLAEIAISSADSSINFGMEPKIAMLSYSSGASGKGADVDIVRRATEIVKEKRPDLKVEGPIQYDAAVDITIGKSKLPDSEVAGQANVLIFPDLNTGNNTYKAVQRETGALAIGPMLQGLNKPVNDLSRGCTIDDIFNTVILTAIQAQDIE
ncbi:MULTISPECIES: phosphate acetyltransferase [Flavobacteriaceae]|uniref:Phosphate acetyltransferase n=2 Tax=Flavobacteriaceae TaxID=49546 RepID=A0A4Y8AV20_9FLAO|nr:MULTISPECIES: phosphate acetyltransferase [Flavobacteriaceae]TEW76396.1 phosphate acetyltransferase [Gramella jeungdoensis]GGK52509.1 phosphate acetyltransferase [Lutibacter litoralis]